ncbi:hypothetical protein [Microlunatus aurantiacus]|uniref:hypothetical protein n=1 Tax=Microlunatus aurantiacus TaxID=446786 RepID=UPI0031D4E239
MSYEHLLSSVAEDRDLSRAADERYLMMQSLPERPGEEQPRQRRLATLRREPAPPGRRPSERSDR